MSVLRRIVQANLKLSEVVNVAVGLLLLLQRVGYLLTLAGDALIVANGGIVARRLYVARLGELLPDPFAGEDFIVLRPRPLHRLLDTDVIVD